MLELIFAAMALGIILLVGPYLLLQLNSCKHLLPLLSVLLSLAVLATGPLVFLLCPSLVFVYIAALPLAFFALSPGLWLYTCALTAELQPWHFRRSCVWHYLPMVYAVMLGVLIQSLSFEQQQLLFFAENSEVTGRTLLVAIAFLIAVLFWLGQSCFYLWLIIRRVRRYRQQLRQVFAEDRGKRLKWLEVLLALVLVSWLCAVLNLLGGESSGSVWWSDVMVLFCVLLLVWLLAWVGLTQQPGFSNTYKVERCSGEMEEAKSTDTEIADTASGKKKYQRSALGEQQSLRIAEKLQHAMHSDRLYQDEALTLYKLAEYLAVPAHYLSQTLNQTLQMSFFEFVNQARVEAAKQKLRQSDESVLTIAMSVGFNARSSFYKAFKANTGQTPAEFRVTCQQSRDA